MPMDRPANPLRMGQEDGGDDDILDADFEDLGDDKR